MRISTETRDSFTHTGSSFDDFLEETNIKQEVEDAAIKKVQAWQSQSRRTLPKAGATDVNKPPL